MTTPAAVSNPVRQTQDIQDEKVREAYQQGHDADRTTEESYTTDIEKGPQSQAQSTYTDERTLSGDVTQDPGAPQDPNIVDWDGPSDPANPQNWPMSKKWGIIASLGACTLITPLASSFFAPGVPQVLREFHETSNVMAAFVVSVYILGFAIGPLFIAPLSELYGRIYLYNVCNLLFIIFNVACALSKSMGMLIAFRFFAGCAGSAPLTIGGGTIADSKLNRSLLPFWTNRKVIKKYHHYPALPTTFHTRHQLITSSPPVFPPEQRAGAMAIWSLGPLLGPVIGPVCGGFLVENLSWRWVFWILAIFGGAFGLILLVVGSESYGPTLLERKAAALRKATGNPEIRSKLAKNIPPREVFIRAISRPMKMLFLSPIVGLMSLYIAVNYGILYLFFTTITFVFEQRYHFSSGAVGLSYIGSGVGMLVGMGVLGVMSDKVIKKQQAKGNVKPEHRLPLMLTVPGAVALPIGVFVYGWTVRWIHARTV